jgi:phytoene desaturase
MLDAIKTRRIKFMAEKYPIIIIGGGIGGLTTAILLAKKGYKVVIYEKNQRIGGKMAEIYTNGFRWGIGPSVITMRNVIEDLFSACNKKLQDYVQLIPVDPITKYFFSDGKKIEIWRDLARTTAGISRIEPRDVEGYLSFLAYAARQYRLTSPIYTYGPPPTWRSIRKIGLGDILRVDAFRDMNSVIQEYVISPAMRQFLSRFATYVGANPYQAPALLSVIAHVELTDGVWYPRGGVYGIAEALQRLAIELGVKIITNSEIKEIVIQEKTIKGVLTESGIFHESEIVISNLDVASTYANLLPQKPPYVWELDNLSKAPSSYSAFIILLGIKGIHAELGHHNILFSSDYHKEFKQISKGIPPDDPTVYIAITSKVDYQHAPSGCENWFVMVNVPPIGPAYDWRTKAEDYRNVVIQAIQDKGFEMTEKIITEQIITPIDLQNWSGAYRGALYGMSFDDWTAPFRRPRPKSQNISGLYFVGGTTHPGGGIPMVMLSGKYVAQQVDFDVSSDTI